MKPSKEQIAAWVYEGALKRRIKLAEKADIVGALDKIAERRRRPKVAARTYRISELNGSTVFSRGKEQLVTWSAKACETRLIKLLEDVAGDTRSPAVLEFWANIHNFLNQEDDMKLAYAVRCVDMMEEVWNRLLTPPPMAEPDIFSAPELVDNLSDDIFAGFGV